MPFERFSNGNRPKHDQNVLPYCCHRNSATLVYGRHKKELIVDVHSGIKDQITNPVRDSGFENQRKDVACPIKQLSASVFLSDEGRLLPAHAFVQRELFSSRIYHTGLPEHFSPKINRTREFVFIDTNGSAFSQLLYLDSFLWTDCGDLAAFNMDSSLQRFLQVQVREHNF